MKSRFYEISFGKVSWATSLILVQVEIVVQVEDSSANLRTVFALQVCESLVGAKIAVKSKPNSCSGQAHYARVYFGCDLVQCACEPCLACLFPCRFVSVSLTLKLQYTRAV